jgi:hypothetical protein
VWLLLSGWAAGKLSCESIEALGKLPKQASVTLKIALPKNHRDAVKSGAERDGTSTQNQRQ